MALITPYHWTDTENDLMGMTKVLDTFKATAEMWNWDVITMVILSLDKDTPKQSGSEISKMYSWLSFWSTLLLEVMKLFIYLYIHLSHYKE